MVDDKFIDRFIEDAERISPGRNTYVFTFNSPGKYAKSGAGIYAPYGSERLNQIISQVRKADKVFVHWFNDALMPYINRLHPDTKLYLLFWGGDFLEQSVQSLDFNLEKLTRGVYDRLNRYAMFHLTMNPLNFIMQIKMFLSVNKRWKKWREDSVAVRKEFMKRLDYFCHWNEADFDEVRSEYGGRAEFRYFFYAPRFDQFPSELVSKGKSQRPVVWLGNSATFTNNHLDALEVLRKFKHGDLQLLLPVSYGNRNYARIVERKGTNIFGNKLTAIKDFMSIDRYFEMLRDVDIVVMYHNRTQAAGNVFAFLKMGKKVYLKEESSIYKLAIEKNMVVFNANNLDKEPYEAFITPLSEEQQKQNAEAVEDFLSGENYQANMNRLLN